MSIRLRLTLDAGWVALCAARSVPMPGDVYLDDGHHWALAQKLWREYPACGIATDPAIDAATEREESDNANRADWERRFGEAAPSRGPDPESGSVVLAVDPSRFSPDAVAVPASPRAGDATTEVAAKDLPALVVERLGRRVEELETALRDTERLVEKLPTFWTVGGNECVNKTAVLLALFN
jgi:hypothetical protein